MALGKQCNLLAFLALIDQGIGNAFALQTPDDKTCFIQMSVAQQGNPDTLSDNFPRKAPDTYIPSNTSNFPKVFSTHNTPVQHSRGPFDWLKPDNHINNDRKTPKVSKMKFLVQWKQRFPGSIGCGADPNLYDCAANPSLADYHDFEWHDGTWPTNDEERAMSAASNWDTAIQNLFGREALNDDNPTHPDLIHNVEDWCHNNPAFRLKAPPESLGPRDNADGRGLYAKLNLADAAAADRALGPHLIAVPSHNDLTAIVPRVCDPARTLAERRELLRKTPEMRAMSVTSLRKILQFIQQIASINRDALHPDGWMTNPSRDRGKGCSNNRYRPCNNDGDCAGGFCNTQLRLRVDQVNMHHLNALFVMPLTWYSQHSLADHIGGGVPHFFISHNWSGPFQKFVGAVLTHFRQVRLLEPGRTEDNTFYWVCTFGVNQHNAATEVGESIYGPFWYGIQFSQMVISIQDDSQALFLFTGLRSWCVFELAVANLMRVEWRFICTTGGGAIFDWSGYSVMNNACNHDLATQLLTWDAEKATTGEGLVPLENRMDINAFIRVSQCYNVPVDTADLSDGEDCLQVFMQRYGVAIAAGCGAGVPGKSRVLSWPFGQTAGACTCDKYACLKDSVENLVKTGHESGNCPPSEDCTPYNAKTIFKIPEYLLPLDPDRDINSLYRQR